MKDEQLNICTPEAKVAKKDLTNRQSNKYHDARFSFTYLLTKPFAFSLSKFLPSTAFFKTYDAPTLNRRNGKPALMKRWKLDGCSEDLTVLPPTSFVIFAVRTNLYCLRAAAAAVGGELMLCTFLRLPARCLTG